MPFWHFLNAVLCLFLIVTGISMQFSNPDVPLVKFNTAVSIHNISGVMLTLSYLIFFFGNLFTSNGKFYKLAFKGFWARLWLQFKYYTGGIFKSEEPPFQINETRKFNPLQQISYGLIMYLFVPVVFVTGIGLMYPDVIPTNILGFGGLHFTDLIHIISSFVISMFMFVHIYFCTIGKSPVSNFRSMMTGYHEPH